MKRAIVVVILAVLTGTNLLAQDQRVFSQFFMNPYIYNPAYAGVEGHTVFYGLYRMQYMGIEGAPTFSHVNFHTPLKNNLAMGALVYNESEGPLNTSGGKVTLGYILELDKKHYVRFGMSLGGGYTGYDQSEINVGLDPTFQNLASNSFVTADFGVSYHFDHFNVGFAMPNLLGREVITENGFAPLSFNDNMMLKVNYRGHINDNFAIEPHIIYRFSTVNMPQYEVVTLLHIMHIAWAGVSYRQDAGIAGLVGFKVKDQFGIGFAYELGNSELSDVTSGTAEVHVGYHFGDKKKHHKHSHSFIKSHRKTKEQREREEARRQRLAQQRKEQAERRAAEARAAREATAIAATGTDTGQSNSSDSTSTSSNEPTNAVASEPIKEEVDSTTPTQERTSADGTVEVGTTYIVTNADGTTTKEIRWEAAQVAETPVATTSGKPEMVNANTARKGNHFLELPVGHHVVAAQFKDFDQAEDYSDTLFERGFHGTIVGFVSAVGEYFVVVHKGATPEQAEEEQKKWQKLKDLDHVYIFNVVE